MGASERADDVLRGTVGRIGIDDSLEMTVDCKTTITLERAPGGRFRVLVKSDRPVSVKRRKRKAA